MDYDPEWPRAFEGVKDELAQILGGDGAEIHHIGSTSVPGLAAKPVIDVLVAVPEISVVDRVSSAMEARGYDARGEYGIEGRRYFSRPSGAGVKTHVHIFALGHAAIERHLALRDYLRAHPVDATSYGNLKKALADVRAPNRSAYQALKADAVGWLQQQALPWYRRTPPKEDER